MVHLKMGNSLKGKNLLAEVANTFLYEQFLIVWKITIIAFGDLHLVFNYCFITYVRNCVMGATPMLTSVLLTVYSRREKSLLAK